MHKALRSALGLGPLALTVLLSGGSLGCHDDATLGLSADSIDTEVSAAVVLQGESFEVTCFISGVESNSKTRVKVRPDSAATVEGHTVTAVALEPLEVACALRTEDLEDPTPASVLVRPQGVASIDTVVDPPVVAAGEQSQVSCRLADALGRPVEGSTTWSISPDPLGERSEDTLSPELAGSYDVQCKIVGGITDDSPAVLTVTPGNAARLYLDVEPFQRVYRLGQELTISPIVTDSYDNELLDADVILDIPEGILPLIGNRYRLDASGEHLVRGHLAPPLEDVSDQIRLVVDGEAPELTLFEPPRGAVLEGPALVRVSGQAEDRLGDVQELRINGDIVELDSAGRFEAELDLTHGLNLIRVEAEDNSGMVARTTRGVLWSPTLLAAPRDEAPNPYRQDGMVAFIGRQAFDDGDHPCRYEEGEYRCDEINDLATVLEILLNNIQMEDMPEQTIFERSFQLVEDGESSTIDLGYQELDLGLVAYAGDLLVDWSWRTDVRFSVEFLADDIDLRQFRAELEPTEGGLIARGEVAPLNGEPGLETAIRARFTLTAEVYLELDAVRWGPDDVTEIACENGIFPSLFDLLDGLIGADFSGPLCDGEPAGSVIPQANAVGAGFAVDTLSFEAEMGATIDPDGLPEVSLLDLDVADPGGNIDLSLFEDLRFDLGEIEIFELIELPLGEFELDISFLDDLADQLISPLLQFVRPLVAEAIEETLQCTDNGVCLFDLAGGMESFLASIAASRTIPLYKIPGEPLAGEAAVVTSGRFSLLEFDRRGGLLGLATVADASPEPEEEPAGILMRGECDDEPEVVPPPPVDASMQYSVHIDHWNQALHAIWRSGNLDRRLDLAPPGVLGGIVSGVTLSPMGPPAVSNCNQKGAIHLLTGDLRFSIHLEGSEALTGWVSLDRESEIGVNEDRDLLVLPAAPGGLLWEFDQIPEQVLEVAPELVIWLTGEVVSTWLASVAEVTLSTLAAPHFRLAELPGLPEDLIFRVAARDSSGFNGYVQVRGAPTGDALPE